MICQECGREIPKNSTQCSYCKLKFCHGCGKVFKGNVMRCPDCGEPLYNDKSSKTTAFKDKDDFSLMGTLFAIFLPFISILIGVFALKGARKSTFIGAWRRTTLIVLAVVAIAAVFTFLRLWELGKLEVIGIRIFGTTIK